MAKKRGRTARRARRVDSRPITQEERARLAEQVVAGIDDRTRFIPLVAGVLNLLATVEATGGLIRLESGLLAPCGDPEWVDLGECASELNEALRGLGAVQPLTTKKED